MLISQFIALATPKSCRGCGRAGCYVCEKCLRQAINPRKQVCYRCLWGTPGGQLCIGCEFYSSLAGTTVVARYDGIVRDLILGLKSHNDTWAAEVLGAMMARSLLRTGRSFDLVTAIPTSPSRYHERGYNPAERLAKVIAGQLGLPYRPLLLRLTVQHQIGQNRQQRLQQIHGAFYVPRPRAVRQHSVILADDVLTTGATLEEAAHLLRQSGAKQVWGTAVARH